MSGLRTYLDFNATSPLRPEARSALVGALDRFGNPSSVHDEGRQARAVVEAARGHVARLVGAEPTEVVFTSSGTEGAAAVLAMDWDAIVVSQVEHSAVLASARRAGRRTARVMEVGVTASGTIDLEACEHAMAEAAGSGGRALIALQMANNETGVIQPCQPLFEKARELGLDVLCDAVQTAGRVRVDIAELGADFVVISGHKIGAPKGSGALIVRDGAHFEPLLTGGGQEQNRRAGTENTAAIAGFGAAAEAALRDLDGFERLRVLRDRLELEIASITPDALIIGSGAERLANTSAVALPGRRGETLVIALDLAGVAVSSGSACSSGKVGRSHVLEAMGLSAEAAQSAIRVSLGWTTTPEDVDQFLAAWADIARREGAARKVA